MHVIETPINSRPAHTEVQYMQHHTVLHVVRACCLRLLFVPERPDYAVLNAWELSGRLIVKHELWRLDLSGNKGSTTSLRSLRASYPNLLDAPNFGVS